MTRAELVREQLERCGIEYLLWLPDSETKTLYDTLLASPKLRMVPVCREDEAMGIYAGLWMGGKKSGAVMMQSTGLFAAMDALRAIVINGELPLLMLIGYKGYQGMIQGKKQADCLAPLTEPLLDVLGIKHYLMDADEDVECIGRAYREAMASSRPVAVLITKEQKR